MFSSAPTPAPRQCQSRNIDAVETRSRGTQLDLFLDYANNVKLYPKFQAYFRQQKPPLLAIWGNFDPYFIPTGAEAFRKDIPNATVSFLPTGHFALETHLEEIVVAMREFLQTSLTQLH